MATPLCSLVWRCGPGRRLFKSAGSVPPSASSLAAVGGGVKREGDISDAFASMSGRQAQPLPDRFRQRKLDLVRGHEDAVVAGWRRLLMALQRENSIIAQHGPAIVPQIQFNRLGQDLARRRDEIRKRGVAVIKGVIPEDEARAYKSEIEDYVWRNPHTRGDSVWSCPSPPSPSCPMPGLTVGPAFRLPPRQPTSL